MKCLNSFMIKLIVISAFNLNLSVVTHGISNIIVFFDINRAHGYSSEDVQMVIESMAAQGKEPTFCMGDDAPLAILSQKSHMLYDYFKQRFAQV